MHEPSRQKAAACLETGQAQGAASVKLLTDYRDLARTLGGCPTNEVSSRFTTVSILNTALQEVVALEVCGAALDGNPNSVDIQEFTRVFANRASS